MKKALFAVLFCPLFGLAQCPNYINQDKQQSLNFIHQLDSITSLGVYKDIDTSQKEEAVYRAEGGGLLYRIEFEARTSFQTTRRIYIIAPADKLNAFYNDFLMPQISSCIEKKAGFWVYYNKTVIVFADAGRSKGKALKSIEIEYRDNM